MSFEWNKIFAAILVAGIVAKLAGFVAGHVVHPEKLTENAYKVEVAEEAGAAGAEGGAEQKAGPILALLSGADVEKGQKISKACATCHTFEKGGEHRIGPNLWNIVNAKKAHASDFAYSPAISGMGGTWTYQNLNSFLWKPKAYADGTKMNFIGLKKDEDRAAIIAWLRTLSDSPAALPSKGDIDAELASVAAATPVAAPAAPAAETTTPAAAPATPAKEAKPAADEKLVPPPAE